MSVYVHVIFFVVLIVFIFCFLFYIVECLSHISYQKACMNRYIPIILLEKSNLTCKNNNLVEIIIVLYFCSHSSPINMVLANDVSVVEYL